MSEHPRPALLVTFDDPADVRRAFEDLRYKYRCAYEDGGILVVGRGEDGTRWLRHDPRADAAYREVERDVSDELLRAESQGLVPTLPARHASRPAPNELQVYARTAAWLLVEDPAGGDAGRRCAALKVVAAFNARLQEEGLTDYLVQTGGTRRLYSALRSCVPGLRVEPDTSGGRMYVLGVDWSHEAREWRDMPEFKAPYA